MKISVTQGQSVMFTYGYGSNEGKSGTVTKVGRVWIEVTPDGQAFKYRFRLDTQTDGSDYGAPPRFWTLDQWAERQRRNEATTFLRDQGVDVRYGSPWMGREAELADLIRGAQVSREDEAEDEQ